MNENLHIKSDEKQHGKPNRKLKPFAVAALVLSLATLLIFNAADVPAYAQPQEENQQGENQEENGDPSQVELLSSTGEGQNRVLTSGSRTLAVGERHVYRFDYDGNEQPVRIWMNLTPLDAAQLQIWTDDMYLALASEPDLEPLARGEPLADGSEFLLWQGGSPEAETYYVVIESNDAVDSQYLLNISSLGLSTAQSGIIQPTAIPTSIPTSILTSTPTSEPPTATPEISQDVAEPPAAPDPDVPPTEPDTTVPTAEPDIAVLQAEPDIAVVTTVMLNVRQGPSTAYQVITAVPRDTMFTVLGRNAANTWIAVRLEDGTEGWVTRSLTNYMRVAEVVLTPDPLPAPTPIPGYTPQPSALPDSATTVGEAQEPRALDGDWRVLREGETHFYTFQYRGGQLPVHVWMDVEPDQGAVFNILSRQTALAILAGVAPNVVNAIGRGTANPVEPGYLFWRAGFQEADILYVMVQHEGPGDVVYSIHAAGPGLGRPVPQQLAPQS